MLPPTKAARPSHFAVSGVIVFATTESNRGIHRKRNCQVLFMEEQEPNLQRKDYCGPALFLVPSKPEARRRILPISNGIARARSNK